MEDDIFASPGVKKEVPKAGRRRRVLEVRTKRETRRKGGAGTFIFSLGLYLISLILQQHDSVDASGGSGNDIQTVTFASEAARPAFAPRTTNAFGDIDTPAEPASKSAQNDNDSENAISR